MRTVNRAEMAEFVVKHKGEALAACLTIAGAAIYLITLYNKKRMHIEPSQNLASSRELDLIAAEARTATNDAVAVLGLGTDLKQHMSDVHTVAEGLAAEIANKDPGLGDALRTIAKV